MVGRSAQKNKNIDSSSLLWLNLKQIGIKIICYAHNQMEEECL